MRVRFSDIGHCIYCGSTNEPLTREHVIPRGLDIVLSGHPPVMRQRPHHQIPSIHAVRRLAPGVKIFRGIDLRLDRGDDLETILTRSSASSAAVQGHPQRHATESLEEPCQPRQPETDAREVDAQQKPDHL